MTVIRTMAGGILAAALIVAVGATPRPVVGQPPAATPTQRPPGGLPVTEPAYDFRPGVMNNPFGAEQERSQIAKLAQQYVKATKEDEKKELRKKLSDELGQQFDQLAVKQQKELEDLETQVTALRALLKKRQIARDSIIDRRLDQILQDAEGLGWGTHPPVPQTNSFRRPGM